MSTSSGAPRAIVRIPLSRIQPDPDQPRREFSEESISRLADSIRLHGLLAPLMVREVGEGQYQLVAGARRLRALMQLDRNWAEAIVLKGSACDCAMIALAENMQREPLHFLDVAAACQRILDRYPITQARLAAGLSCSPSALANRLRLLRLPEAVQAAVRSAGLGERHARALLRLRNQEDQLALAELCARKHWSVAQLEKRVQERLEGAAAHSPAPQPRAVIAPRDCRLVVNAVLDTVRRLSGIGLPVQSRVEAGEDCVNVIVSIPAGNTGRGRPTGAINGAVSGIPPG